MDMPTGDRAENWSACKLVNPVAHVTNSAATNVMMTGARTRVHFGFRSTEFVVEGVDVQQRNGYRQYLETIVEPTERKQTPWPRSNDGSIDAAGERFSGFKSFLLLNPAAKEMITRVCASTLLLTENDGVAPQKHLRYETILGHGRALRPSLPLSLGRLHPNLLHVLEHHVAVPIERFHAFPHATLCLGYRRT